MRNNVNSAFQIGTILSFFLLGIDNIPFLSDTIKNIFCFGVFLLIVFSLMYCLFYFFKKYPDVDIVFDAIMQKNIDPNIISMILFKIYNNLNHEIEISIYIKSKKNNMYAIDKEAIQIPYCSNIGYGIHIDDIKNLLIDDKYSFVIMYNFINHPSALLLSRELTKKEIKMFKKLSQK